MPYDSAATRARLLDAAYREFSDQGLAGARVDRIAAAARANKQAIYAYFGSKEDLFDAVLTHRLGELADAVPLTPDDLRHVVCPICHHALQLEEGMIQCRGCGRRYPIIDGIPVDLRDIRIYVDRPEFVINPTSCEPTSTAATVLGSGTNFASEADDRPVTITTRFQAADCGSLEFAPKLAISLKGGTKRSANPALKAVVTPRGHDANIGKASVALPHSEFLEQSHIKTVCTRVQFNAGGGNGEQCPAASIYGRATAVTPLLSEPLRGNVYLRSSSHKLPDLVVALHSTEINIDLDGRIDSVKGGGIRTNFESVPDAPVTKFTLEMFGGKKSLLVNSTNLCKGTHRVTAKFTGQNGKLYNTNPALQAQCGKKGNKKGAAAKKKSKGSGKRTQSGAARLLLPRLGW